jgi:hypothetical protein
VVHSYHYTVTNISKEEAGVWVHVYNPRQEDGEFKASPGKVSKTRSQKQNTNKKTGGVVPVVELLHEALGSIPSTTK